MDHYAYNAPDDRRPKKWPDLIKVASRPYVGLTAFVAGRPHLVVAFDGREYTLEDTDGELIQLGEFLWDDLNISEENSLVAASRIEGSPLEMGMEIDGQVVGKLDYNGETGEWTVQSDSENAIDITTLIDQLEAQGWQIEEEVDVASDSPVLKLIDEEEEDEDLENTSSALSPDDDPYKCADCNNWECDPRICNCLCHQNEGVGGWAGVKPLPKQNLSAYDYSGEGVDWGNGIDSYLDSDLGFGDYKDHHIQTTDQLLADLATPELYDTPAVTQLKERAHQLAGQMHFIDSTHGSELGGREAYSQVPRELAYVLDVLRQFKGADLHQPNLFHGATEGKEHKVLKCPDCGSHTVRPVQLKKDGESLFDCRSCGNEFKHHVHVVGALHPDDDPELESAGENVWVPKDKETFRPPAAPGDPVPDSGMGRDDDDGAQLGFITNERGKNLVIQEVTEDFGDSRVVRADDGREYMVTPDGAVSFHGHRIGEVSDPRLIFGQQGPGTGQKSYEPEFVQEEDARDEHEMEDHEGKTASFDKTTDTDGNPLKEGWFYAMHSPKYRLPDHIHVVQITPDLLIATTHEGSVTLKIKAADLTSEEYSFEPLIVENADSKIESYFIATARRQFSPTQQRAFIEEEGKARNSDKLNLDGTHYGQVDNEDGEHDVFFLW